MIHAVIDSVNSLAGAGFIVATSLATALYYMVRFCRTSEYLMIGRAIPFFFTAFVYCFIVYLELNNLPLSPVRAMSRINVLSYAVSFGITAYTAERIRNGHAYDQS